METNKVEYRKITANKTSVCVFFYVTIVSDDQNYSHSF